MVWLLLNKSDRVRYEGQFQIGYEDIALLCES